MSVQGDSNLTQSSRLSIGDYIPNAFIESEEHRLDIQVKAGEPNIFVVIKRSHTALAQGAANLKLPYRHFVITEDATGLEHSRLFTSAEFSSLFLHPLVPLSAFVTDANLKVVDFVDAQNLEELEAEVAQIKVVPRNLPAPVRIIPDAIDEALAEDLIHYLDGREDSLLTATSNVDCTSTPDETLSIGWTTSSASRFYRK